MFFEKGKGNMKTFVITTVLTVMDVCKEYRATKEMVERLMIEKTQTGVIDENCFRQRVVLNVQNVHSEVMEL